MSWFLRLNGVSFPCRRCGSSGQFQEAFLHPGGLVAQCKKCGTIQENPFSPDQGHTDDAEFTAQSAPRSALDICDCIVPVEDRSDETYVRWWMARILAPERWKRISNVSFFHCMNGRPTPDEVNQRLDAVKHSLRQLHPGESHVQPKAMVIVDRDYRPPPELEDERQKLQKKAFQHITWFVWPRVEIENYLLCPGALVRYVLEHAPLPPTEEEVQTEIESAIEMSRGDARKQLIDAFGRWSRKSEANWSYSTIAENAEEFLDSVWKGDGRLSWCDAKKVVLPRLRQVFKQRWNVSVSEQELIRGLREQEVPSDVVALTNSIASFIEGSRWARVHADDNSGLRPLLEAMRNENAAIRRSAVENLAAFGRKAVQALIGALRDMDLEVRRVAAFSLYQIGPDAAPAVDALASALADPDHEVKDRAAAALGAVRAACQTSNFGAYRVIEGYRLALSHYSGDSAGPN
jgi:HEAT repeats